MTHPDPIEHSTTYAPTRNPGHGTTHATTGQSGR